MPNTLVYRLSLTVSLHLDVHEQMGIVEHFGRSSRHHSRSSYHCWKIHLPTHASNAYRTRKCDSQTILLRMNVFYVNGISIIDFFCL